MTPELARALADAFLVADWTPADLRTAGQRVLGRRARWLAPLTEQVLQAYGSAPRDAPRELAGVVQRLPAAARARRTRPVRHPVAPTRMVRNPWHLPELHTLEDVAALLGMHAPELAWFADVRSLSRSAHDPRLRHYAVTTRPASSGAVRVLEAPKPRLKAVQRQLLAQVLGGIPRSDAAHGFCPGRSVASYAAPHAGSRVVVRLDLEGFFASVSAGRVHGVLRTAGYPEPVAHCLTGLVTTVLARREWQQVPRPADPGLLDAHWRLGRRLAVPHLPQGAPTSPVLADLAAARLDRRLDALARAWGGRYTRYADDLALSGPWRRTDRRLTAAVEQVVLDEGFRLNAHKTAVQPCSGRQVLGGLVVNDRPRVGRREVDLLRAVVHNCVVHGPSTQDRSGVPDFRSHLHGRVAWVAQHDPARGARLRADLARVDWSR